MPTCPRWLTENMQALEVMNICRKLGAIHTPEKITVNNVDDHPKGGKTRYIFIMQSKILHSVENANHQVTFF